jgi:hypothetical protein
MPIISTTTDSSIKENAFLKLLLRGLFIIDKKLFLVKIQMIDEFC